MCERCRENAEKALNERVAIMRLTEDVHEGAELQEVYIKEIETLMNLAPGEMSEEVRGELMKKASFVSKLQYMLKEALCALN